MATPRHSKFELDPAERLISGLPVDSETFADALLTVSNDRVDYLVQSYVRDRTPSAFEHTPMLWGALRAWLSNRVNRQCEVSISPWEWGLNGSANLGFSASPDKFGTKFGSHSDLDLFLVNAETYEKLAREARIFSSSNSDLNRYSDARDTVNRQLARGMFLDTKQIPASDKFPINATLLNEISIIVDKLRMEGYAVERSFVRVYKNWNGLARQLRLNILSLREKLAANQNR